MVAEPVAGANAAGTNGAVGNGGAAPAGSSGFTLLFRDDFETLDLKRWQLMTHSRGSNLALFSDRTVAIADGNLVISLLPAPDGTVDDSNTPKPYLGTEVRSLDTLTYGRVRSRLKFAKGSAVVSSLVTIYTPWPADDWNELDMECLGASPAKVAVQHHGLHRAPTQPPVTTSVTPTAEPIFPVWTSILVPTFIPTSWSGRRRALVSQSTTSRSTLGPRISTA
jgi:endo-1,3-1,4-beta-glycanase ExoK